MNGMAKDKELNGDKKGTVAYKKLLLEVIVKSNICFRCRQEGRVFSR
jgi:hypothetical protein